MVGNSNSGVFKGLIPVEQAMRLDVRKLDPSCSFSATLNWSICGTTSSIGVTVTPEAVELSYMWAPAMSDAKPIRASEHIRLHWRARHFGGREALFVCPGCYDKAFHLYYRGGRFRCRDCARMTYSVRNETTLASHIRKARKLRAKLGGGPSLADPVPPKPRGMWWSTYDRLCANLAAFEGAMFSA